MLRQFKIKARVYGGCACHPDMPKREQGYYHAFRNLAFCFEQCGQYAFRVEPDLTGSLLIDTREDRPEQVDEIVGYLIGRNGGMYVSFDLQNIEEVIPPNLTFDDFGERYRSVFETRDCKTYGPATTFFMGVKIF